jgi:hypothetical protein
MAAILGSRLNFLPLPSETGGGRDQNSTVTRLQGPRYPRGFERTHERGKGDADNPIWTITPFVDAPGNHGTSKYFFEWEREWRKAGDFTFTTDEVEFLMLPEGLHEAARGFFKNKIKPLLPK